MVSLKRFCNLYIELILNYTHLLITIGLKILAEPEAQSYDKMQFNTIAQIFSSKPIVTRRQRSNQNAFSSSINLESHNVLSKNSLKLRRGTPACFYNCPLSLLSIASIHHRSWIDSYTHFNRHLSNKRRVRRLILVYQFA